MNGQSFCVYCDLSLAATVDHVVPRCVFPPPLPANMLTVPSCLSCNAAKSKDDDYLRDMLLLDRENEGHSQVKGVIRQKVVRSIVRNSSHLVREGRRMRRMMPYRGPDGRDMGEVPAIPLEQDRVGRMFGRIVRGLCYRLFAETRLPADCVFEVSKVHAWEKDRALDQFDRPAVRTYQIADVFTCYGIVAVENPAVNLWLLKLLDVMVLVSTDDPKRLASGQAT